MLAHTLIGKAGTSYQKEHRIYTFLSLCGLVSFIENEATLMSFLRVFRHLVENQMFNGPHLAQLKHNLRRLAAAQLFIAKTHFLPGFPFF